MPPHLKDVSITFNTHGDDKAASTVLHVFVRNRASTSQTPEGANDFISNWLALQRYQSIGDLNDGDRNPYLAYGLDLAKPDPPVPLFTTIGFDDPSSHTFSLQLTSDTIAAEEIDLPAVDIHILTDDDRWIFDYSITFTFDDTSAFTYSSKADGGINGIILDQDNHNYSGICSENPFRRIEPLVKAPTSSVLKKVTIEFVTNKDNKDADTRLNVHIVNRLGATSDQDIAIGLDLLPGQEFPGDGSSLDARYKSFSWSADEGSLAGPIHLADLILPITYIVIYPHGNHRWSFAVEVTFEFSDPSDFEQKRQIYSSRTNGIVLDRDNNKYACVYQGRPFPTQARPATAPVLADQPVDRTHPPKKIPISFLQAKFDEFVNERNGPDTSDNPPLRKIRLDNSGPTNSQALRESYADIRAISALSKPWTSGQPKMNYVSSPRSLGQLSRAWGFGDLYIQDIKTASLGLTVDPSQTDGPFTLRIVFETGGPIETIRGESRSTGEMDFTNFEITIKFTLAVKRTTNAFGVARTVIDTMSWVDELPPFTDPIVGPVERIAMIEKYLHVSLTTSSKCDPGGLFRQGARDALFSALTTPDVITKRTGRDAINSMITSWLLGGVADDDRNTDGNNAIIDSVSIDQDNITLSYAGPRKVFAPQVPPNWPAGHDFSPGNLANIDHIVVLMMENRSFDHMLGYLSLSAAEGGAGRRDVDGLKGGESNSYLGVTYPSHPLSGTLFAPDPPHGYEPVARAINGGLMDGFAASYGNAHGRQLAGTIMGHQTAATVPTYDALVRDFAIGQRWFASHPGPTFCNRFYTLTGRLNLDARGFWEFDNSSPLLPVFTPTIFDHLTSASVSWAYFEHGYCSLRFFERHTFDNANIFTADDPELGFFARAHAGSLPSVSFIDPHFVEYPPDANCDGPPADVADGQRFVRKVVESVVASPAWNKTMMLIVYDEHGGFYDHVPPPQGAPASPDFPIKTLGVRVPSFVISPWVKGGTVFGYGGSGDVTPTTTATARALVPEARTPVATSGLHFDHTSILKTIARRFLNRDPPYLGARYAAAEDLSKVIGNELHESQFLPFIGYTIEFVGSQMVMDVQVGNPAPRTPIWQFEPNGTTAQNFAFEDAGNGFVYIRSNVSNLYVTVDAGQVGGTMPTAEAAETTSAPAATPARTGRPGVVVRGPLIAEAGVGAVATTGDTAPSPTVDMGPGLIQDVKYHSPGHVGTVVVGSANPEHQKWRLSPLGITFMERNLFVISNQAFPGKVLQPASPGETQSPIVLGDPGETVGIHARKNAWKVSTPLISDEPVLAQ
jgi:Phosphoesterase family/Ricin-type beta-trefoil lectin domain-like